jgi:hypothetical protein
MATNPEILSQLLEILKPFTKEGQQLREETKLVAEKLKTILTFPSPSITSLRFKRFKNSFLKLKR